MLPLCCPPSQREKASHPPFCCLPLSLLLRALYWTAQANIGITGTFSRGAR